MKHIYFTLASVLLAVSGSAQVALVANLNTSPDTTSHPSWFTVFNNNLYFLANPGPYSLNLYKMTSPAATPTSLGPDITNPAQYYFIDEVCFRMASCNGRLYLPGQATGDPYRGLWSTDGNNPATAVYTPGSALNSLGTGGSIASVSGMVYFTSGYTGGTIMRYNPLTLSTSTVAAAAAISTPNKLIEANNKLYFKGDSSLYYYDPLGDSVHKVTTTMTRPQEITAVNGGAGNIVVVFSAVNPATGREPYSYNELSAPVMISDIRPGAADGMASTADIYQFERRYFAVMNNKIYISGVNNTGIGLFEYNPATNVTTMLTPSTAIIGPRSLVVNQNVLYFIGSATGQGNTIWRYDGVHAPLSVADVFPSTSQDFLNDLTSYQGDLIFYAASTGANAEPYRFHDASLSVQHMKFDGKVNVYPNPAINQLTMSIELKETLNAAIRLTDVAGKGIYAVNEVLSAGHNSISIPVHSIASGTYTITLLDEKGQLLYSSRILKH